MCPGLAPVVRVAPTKTASPRPSSRAQERAKSVSSRRVPSPSICRPLRKSEFFSTATFAVNRAVPPATETEPRTTSSTNSSIDIPARRAAAPIDDRRRPKRTAFRVSVRRLAFPMPRSIPPNPRISSGPKSGSFTAPDAHLGQGSQSHPSEPSRSIAASHSNTERATPFSTHAPSLALSPLGSLKLTGSPLAYP